MIQLKLLNYKKIIIIKKMIGEYEIVPNYRGFHNEINIYRHKTNILLGITYCCVFGMITFMYHEIIFNNIIYLILSFFGFPISFIIIYRIIQKMYFFFICPNQFIIEDLEVYYTRNYPKKFTNEFYREKLIKNHKLIENCDEECPICLENNNEKIRLYCNRKLICSKYHEFCIVCITDWLQKNNNTCPICREIILTEKMLEEDDI